MRPEPEQESPAFRCGEEVKSIENLLTRATVRQPHVAVKARVKSTPVARSSASFGVS